jgi:hypothetical protein
LAESIPGYGIIGLIGQGATGRVYLAMQLELERRVAIKELSAELVAVPGFIERFREEARVMGRLESPHCVRALDLIENPTGAYLVQELVLGSSLEAVIADAGKLAGEQALGVVHGSLTGLAYAHSLGLVHRDIKPANILVDLDGRSRLADFGLAAPAGQAAAAGLSLGTAAYMSPEQVEGGAVGPAADIYSAGVLLYELLAGRRPFAATDPLVLMRLHVTQAPPAPGGIAGGMADLVMQCLAKDPGARPSSVDALLAELEARAAEDYGADWAARASVATLAAAAFAGSTLALVSGAGAAAAGAAQVGSATVASATTAGSTTASSAATAGSATTAGSTSAAAATGASAAAAAAADAAPVVSASTTAATTATPAAAAPALAHAARTVARRFARLTVPAKAAVVGVAVVAVAAAVVAARPSNVLANSGFETAGLASQLRTIPVAQSQGAWLAAGQTQVPVRTTAQPVHSGTASGEVHTPAGGGSGYFLQDVPSLTATSNYELAAWVYPVVGKQAVEVLYGWDRTGSASSASYIIVEPGRTSFGAFGATATGPAISYRAWHELRLKVDAGRHVATLLIDGKEVGTSPAVGAAQATGALTVIVGQGTGGSNPEDHFYYDDVSLTPTYVGIGSP